MRTQAQLLALALLLAACASSEPAAAPDEINDEPSNGDPG